MKYKDEWGNVYNTCVIEFTGRNGTVVTAVPELADVANKAGPLRANLIALDDALPENATPGTTPDFDKKFKVWSTEQKKLDTTANTYGAFIKTAMDALKVVEATYPKAYRAVKTLAKTLNEVVFRAQNQARTLSTEVQKAAQKIDKRVVKETDKLRVAGLDDGQIKVEMVWLKAQKMLLLFPTSFRAAYAKSEAIVQKIKLTPTKQTYNTEMAGARDMTQNMCNVIKLLGDQKCPQDLRQAVNGLANYRAQLDAFGNGNKRTVDDTKTQPQIYAQAKEFNQLIKAIKPYAESLGTYLATRKL